MLLKTFSSIALIVSSVTINAFAEMKLPELIGFTQYPIGMPKSSLRLGGKSEWQPTKVETYSFWDNKWGEGEWNKYETQTFSFYDSTGLLKSKTESSDTETRYSYDSEGRLTEEENYRDGVLVRKTVIEYHDVIPEAVASETYYRMELDELRPTYKATCSLDTDDLRNVTHGVRSDCRYWYDLDDDGNVEMGMADETLYSFSVQYNQNGLADKIAFVEYDYMGNPFYRITYSDIIWNRTNGRILFTKCSEPSMPWDSYNYAPYRKNYFTIPFFHLFDDDNRIASAVLTANYEEEEKNNDIFYLSVEYPDDRGSHELVVSYEDGSATESLSMTDNWGSYDLTVQIQDVQWNEETGTWSETNESFEEISVFDEYGIQTYFDGKLSRYSEECSVFIGQVTYDDEYGYPLEFIKIVDGEVEDKVVFSDYIKLDSSNVDDLIGNENTCGNENTAFFTLSGIKVDSIQMKPGLYIRKDCNGVSKIIVK